MLDRLETMSRRSLCCIVECGQSLSSISVRHSHDRLEQLKLCLNL